MLKDLYTKKRSQGFTIIEVMIVLAIAGLIMLIVLIAIPQLQRNQRNTARKDILGRIKTETDSYSGNNNGAYPVSAAELASFNTRYLSGINIQEPTTGTNFTLTFQASSATAEPTYAANKGTIFYYTNAKCVGEDVQAGSGSRAYALAVGLEGGAVFCLDNQ